MQTSPKPAWWLVGPPGSGKSHWVQERAKKTGARILRIHARVDRSFRDGRPLLFAMHRASEPTIVWIEGADVLTPEAQAFLRRIIETCSKHVEFVLETRDETRISSPIKSRCITVYFDLPAPNQSWRRLQYNEQFAKLPKKMRDSILMTRDMEEKWFDEARNNPVRGIQAARVQSLDPAILLEKVLQRLDPLKRDMYRRAWGTGRSIWCLLSLALLDAVE
uniref:ATPase AAA-type core domain-containing protein n=1 Tax=viral metagenome TaxID=1070528 RepID=A0A6C0IB76_9ZZZZ